MKHERERKKKRDAAEFMKLVHSDLQFIRAQGVIWTLLSSFVMLQVSRLRINDSGTYQCLVKTGKGTDYKITTLSVMGKHIV